MINQYTFENASGDLVDTITTVELELVYQIVRQLAKGKQLTDDQWQVMMLQGIISLQNSMGVTVSDSVATQAKNIEDITEGAIKIGIKDTDDQLKATGKDVMSQSGFVAQNEKLFGTIAEKLQDDVSNANLTMLRAASSDYTDIINKTLAKKELGAITRQQALEEVVTEWSKKGLPSLVDRAGKRWTPEAYVDMVVRTNSLDIAKATQQRRAQEYDQDLILTSQHADQSAEHAPYANKIYSLSGNDPKYPPFSKATSAGFMTRPNCRHTYSFYIPGVSRKPKTLPKKETDKNSELRQQQRKLERDIRQTKRQLLTTQELAGKDSDSYRILNAKLRDQQAAMRTFINKTGRTRQRQREQLI